MMEKTLNFLHGDKVVWAVAITLSIVSILSVYSSIVTLAYKYQSGDTFYYLFKHSIILLIGFGFILLVHRLNFRYVSKISTIVFWISIVLLFVTFLQGSSINEARRWLLIPVVNQTFQTSDLSKLALLMYISRFITKYPEKLNDLKEVSISLLFPILLTCGLIFKSNLSTCLLILLTSFVVMFLGNVNKRVLSVIVMGAIMSIAMLLLLASLRPGTFRRFDTWKNRIESYNSGGNEGNFQANQSKIAIATGGVFGKGPGKSAQRNFLPHPYSDFIFSIIIEEYGLIGGAILVFLYLILFYRGIRIATSAKDNYGALLAVGLTFSLVFQAFLNMAVATNLIPVTGQTLPLVSMGGTSIWFTCVTIGILLNVSRTIEHKNQVKNVFHSSNINL